MTDWNAIKSSAASLLNQTGLTVTATWGKVSFAGVRTAIQRADVNTDDGLISGHYTFSLLVPASALPSMPTRRDKIAIDGVTYRVIATDTDPVGATVRLDLGDILQ